MEEIEADFSEKPFVRFIDPRGGKVASFEARGVASHAEKLSEYGLLFEDASGKDEEYGIQRINDYLFYDTGKPIAQGNSPRLYVSDRCEQLINSLLEYTAEGGKDEATKDPCDALRYLCISEPCPDRPRRLGRSQARRLLSY